MEKAPGESPRGYVAYEQAHLSILAVRPSERVEVDALRSMFTVPGPLGVLREAGDAVAIRVDGVPNKKLNRIAAGFEPAYVRPNYTASGAGSSSSSGSRP
jgi:hypothetical protein